MIKVRPGCLEGSTTSGLNLVFGGPMVTFSAKRLHPAPILTQAFKRSDQWFGSFLARLAKYFVPRPELYEILKQDVNCRKW